MRVNIWSVMSWRVTMNTTARPGTVRYGESDDSVDFLWEFGSGNVVAEISPCTPWPSSFAQRRREILSRVASEVIRQKAPRCFVKIHETDDRILIVSRRPGGP